MDKQKLHNYVVVDVEGNGRNPAEIVEIAILPISSLFENNDDIGESWLVKPKNSITHFVSKIHGITNSDVKHKQPFDYIKNTIFEKLDSKIIIGHNVSVEYNIIKKYIPELRFNRYLDTLKLSRHIMKDLSSYSLDNLSNTTGDLNIDIKGDFKRHRALYDAYITAKLFEKLVCKIDNEDNLFKICEYKHNKQMRLF